MGGDMKRAPKKSAAQTLFERIIVTWIEPEVKQRAKKGLVDPPLNVLAALVLCRSGTTSTVYLNEEVNTLVEGVAVDTPKPVKAGDPAMQHDILGVNEVKLVKHLRNEAFIFILQGTEGKFFVLSKKMSQIVGTKDFDVLATALAKEGVTAGPGSKEVTIYIDLLKNQYVVAKTPAQKRKVVLQFVGVRMEDQKKKATACIKRRLRLPVLFLFHETEFLSLLREVRDTFADGYFFSCIAAAATTADRICNRLSEKYDLPATDQKWFKESTLGPKGPKLRKAGILTTDQEALLKKITATRNRYLHPKGPVTELGLKRDAFKMAGWLHELLEGTFSIYKDHTILQGKVVPKPLI